MVHTPVARALALTLSLSLALPAASWLMFNGNPQRDGWARDENDISKDDVKKLKVEWKFKVAENKTRGMNSLTAPIIHEKAITDKGFKDLVIVAGANDNISAIDADTGKVFWKRQFTNPGTPRNPDSWLCPNGLNATPIVRRGRGLGTTDVFLITSDGMLRTINLVNGEDRVPPQQFVPAFSKNWSLNIHNDVLFTATSQGCNGAKSAIYAMDLKDPARPVSVALATTTGGAGIWGRAGVAITSDGVAIGETGDGPYDPATSKLSDTFMGVKAEGKELKLVDYYTPANRAWITKKDLDMGCMSPIVFKANGMELVAGAGKEGVIYLLDAKKLGGEDKRTPLFRSKLLTNEDVDFAGRGFWGSLAAWTSPKNESWLYAPAWGPQTSVSDKFEKTYGEDKDGSLMAFKVVMEGGKPVLKNTWRSVNMKTPEPPIVANGIVYVLAGGDNTRQVDSGGRMYSSEERIKAPFSHAILYALDAETGQELWNSGNAMNSSTHFSGIAIAGGRIYVVTQDSTVYAFGVGE